MTNLIHDIAEGIIAIVGVCLFAGMFFLLPDILRCVL